MILPYTQEKLAYTATSSMSQHLHCFSYVIGQSHAPMEGEGKAPAGREIERENERRERRERERWKKETLSKSSLFFESK